MEETKKAIEEKTMKSWEAYLSTLEHSLHQMQRSIEDSISVPSACTNEWCESVEEVIDELTQSIYSLSVPRWADADQKARVDLLKKEARNVYADYLRASA